MKGTAIARRPGEASTARRKSDEHRSPVRVFEHLVADGPDAVIYADAAGFIRYWNAAATRIFGFAEREAIGVRLDLIIPERLRSRHWERYDKVMGGAQSRYGRPTGLDRVYDPSVSR